MFKPFKSFFNNNTVDPIPALDKDIVKDLQLGLVRHPGGKLLLYNNLKVHEGGNLKVQKDCQVYLFENGIVLLENMAGGERSLSAVQPLELLFRTTPRFTVAGLILTKKIKQIRDTSTVDELSLTIEVDSKAVNACWTIIFKDPRNWKRWYSILSTLTDSSKSSADPDIPINS
ncbi:hypothetical protein Clacol_005366 [Clathrus columnatus]|uniref:PH domain-containing protein n=1 Tax=Clathrus columnatus TaxID=1419009 RepID=A0AAV5ADZ6_9AGAM|nr:hypothetical protein Clacol_005366 [Clathrus columnatus]